MNGLLRLLVPNECVHSVSDIDLARLEERGISTLLLDLDNTLVPWRGYEISEDTKTWLRKAGEMEFKACIVSNTRSPKRLHAIALELGMPYTRRGLKPRRAGFREALGILESSPSETAVIGDQIFTDVLGGNRLGVYTILVSPISKKEFFGTRISRQFEKVWLNLLQRRGMLELEHAKVIAAGEQTPEESRQTEAER